MQLPNLILAVVDPAMRPTAASRRAIELARRSKAQLSLCMVVFDERIDATAELVDPEVQRLARHQFIDQKMRWLAQWTSELVGKGLNASCEVLWARHAHEAIIRKVLELRPDLVVKDLPRSTFLRKWSTISTSDWRLVRLCPAPLMLVQPESAALPQRIAAAVDPAHPNAHPTELDDRVVNVAVPLSMATEADLELVHVFPYRRQDEGMSAKLDDVIDELRQKDFKAFEEFANKYSVAPEQRVLLGGQPVIELLQHVDNSNIDLLVIGSQYRGGLGRLWLGSNSESLISQAECDLLMVRPAGFIAELERHRDYRSIREARATDDASA